MDPKGGKETTLSEENRGGWQQGWITGGETEESENAEAGERRARLWRKRRWKQVEFVSDKRKGEMLRSRSET